jgi:hypothetical protein
MKLILLNFDRHNPRVEIFGIKRWLWLRFGFGLRLRKNLWFRFWLWVLTVQILSSTMTENAPSRTPNL